MTLELIPTEDLVNEIKSRYTSLVIFGVQEGTGEGQDTFYHNYSGSKHSCLGLCELMREVIIDEYFGFYKCEEE